RPAPAASASPAANSPASRAVTNKLRVGSADHKAEAAPQSRRDPSMVATARMGVSLLRPADNTKPAAHNPAAETSAAMPRGSTTRSGKNTSAAMSRPVSDHAAARWANRFGKNEKRRDRESAARVAVKRPAVADTGPGGSAALTKNRFRSWRRRRR